MAADAHGTTGTTTAVPSLVSSRKGVGSSEPVTAGRARERATATLVVVAAGGGVLALGWDSGGYGLGVRSAAGVAVWLAVLAASSLIPRPLARLSGVGGLACALLTAFAVESGASAAWGDSAERAVDEAGRVMLFLGVLVLVLLVAGQRHLAHWCDGLALGIVGIGVLALGSRLLPHIVHGLPPLNFLTSVQTRLAYPLGYWTGLGVLVALGLPLLLQRAAEETGPVVRGLAVAPIPLLAAVVYLTSARLAVAVCVIGVVVYFVLSARRWAVLGATLVGGAGSLAAGLVLRSRGELVNGPFGTPRAVADGRTAALLILAACAGAGAAYAIGTRLVPRPPRFSPRGSRAVAVGCALLAVLGVALSHPVARFNAFRSNPPGLVNASVGQHLLSESSNGRWQLWTSAVKEFLHYPLLGHGAGSFEAWWLAHGRGDFFVRNAHSLFLEELGSLGIVGGLLLAGFFLTPFVSAAPVLRGRSARREPVAAATATLAAYVVAAAVDWMWEMTVVTFVGIICAGILLRAANNPGPLGSRRRIRRTWTAGAAIVALAVLALEGTLVLATHDLDSSSNAAAAGDLAGARSAAHSASRLEPWAATPYLQLALVDEKAGDLSQSLTQIDRALARDRTDWQLWVVASRIERKLGETARSHRSLNRAAALNPHASG